MSPGEKYKSYIDIYKHYSELIFKARISIITVIFLAYGYMLGIIGYGVNKDLDPVVTKMLVPICASCFMTLVFLLEVSYYKMFFRAVKALRDLEKDEPGFFSMYQRKHWQFSILYLLASVMYTGIYIYYRSHFWNELTLFEQNLSVIGIFIPIASIVYVFILLVRSYYKIIFNFNVEALPLLVRLKILLDILNVEEVTAKYVKKTDEPVQQEKEMD